MIPAELTACAKEFAKRRLTDDPVTIGMLASRTGFKKKEIAREYRRLMKEGLI